MSQPSIPFTSLSFWGRLSGRAFARSWGRDVMLYTGGVSFFALLAVFPAIAILIGLLKFVMNISQVSEQAAALADVMPDAAGAIFESEIARLASASASAVSFQSAFALVIGGYAAHRGFKALLAGLNLIHDDEASLSFVKFNLLAFFVALAAFVLFTVVSGAVVASRILSHTTGGEGATFSLPLEGVWPFLGLCFGLSCVYRYAMSHRVRVSWLSSIVGGLVATLLTMICSMLCAIYVEQVVELGATYGSIGAVVVLLIWLSWNVNAVFYGGAFATELEILWRQRAPPTQIAPAGSVKLEKQPASQS